MKVLKPMTQRQKGFTLIELMVVIAVIAIVSAIAIPSIMDARKTANEASAISSLRTIVTANEQYQTRFVDHGYAADLTTLMDVGYLDQVLGSGVKAGYQFNYTPGGLIGGSIVRYSCRAEATSQGTTGDRSFFVDDTGVLRFKEGPGASDADAALD